MDQNQFGETRRTTAFFVTRDAAEKAVRDLSAIGYGQDRVTLEASASAEGGLAQSDAERGEGGGGVSHGFIVRVDASAADYERVSAVLDDDATVSMDARNAVRSGGSFFASSGGRGGSQARGAGSDVHVPSFDEVMGYVRDKPLHAVGIAFMIGFVFGRR